MNLEIIAAWLACSVVVAFVQTFVRPRDKPPVYTPDIECVAIAMGPIFLALMLLYGLAGTLRVIFRGRQK
ncbi:MAG TPA: hypothetical protein VN667_09220 [Burkholderiales bacterium]|nr:hypothetical protein [Burkholderiales bacterium]